MGNERAYSTVDRVSTQVGAQPRQHVPADERDSGRASPALCQSREGCAGLKADCPDEQRRQLQPVLLHPLDILRSRRAPDSAHGTVGAQVRSPCQAADRI